MMKYFFLSDGLATSIHKKMEKMKTVLPFFSITVPGYQSLETMLEILFLRTLDTIINISEMLSKTSEMKRNQSLQKKFCLPMNQEYSSTDTVRY